jgi:hypothetical protein
MNTEPSPEVFRAAALGCLVASSMATQLGYAMLATQLFTAAAILTAYAELIERRARRPRVVWLSAQMNAVSHLSAMLTVSVAPAITGSRAILG